MIQITTLIGKMHKYDVENLWVLYIYTEQQMKKFVNNEIVSVYDLKNIVHAPVLQR